MIKMLKIVLLPLLSAGVFADSWQLHSVFKAYDSPRDNGYGIHGTVVAPDGNIWVAIQGGMAGDSLAHTFTAQDGSHMFKEATMSPKIVALFCSS